MVFTTKVRTPPRTEKPSAPMRDMLDQEEAGSDRENHHHSSAKRSSSKKLRSPQQQAKGFIGAKRAKEEYGVSDADLDSLPSKMKLYFGNMYRAYRREDLAGVATVKLAKPLSTTGFKSQDKNTARKQKLDSSKNLAPKGFVGMKRARDEFGLSDADLEILPSTKRSYMGQEYNAFDRKDLARLVQEKLSFDAAQIKTEADKKKFSEKLLQKGFVNAKKAKREYGVNDADLLQITSTTRSYKGKEYIAFSREDVAGLIGDNLPLTCWGLTTNKHQQE